MAKYRIPYKVWAGGTITVETDETDPDKIMDLAYDEGIPGLCHQCGGSNMAYPNSSLEIGDEWEPDRGFDGDGPEILNDDGTPYVAPEA